MVDIMDMEDIFFQILHDGLLVEKASREIAKRLIKEVSDFVEAQQTIACTNCRGYKFKYLKERCQAG